MVVEQKDRQEDKKSSGGQGVIMIQENFMNKVISFIITIFFLLPAGVMAEEPQPAGDLFRKDEVLTLSRCIEIALRQQPSMLASTYTVNAIQSRVGEAQSGYFPQP